MLKEYERVRKDIPACVLPLMKPYIKRVEDALDPWTE